MLISGEQNMQLYYVKIIVEKVRGYCAINYKPGEFFIIERFYIKPKENTNICLHALNAMMTLLIPFVKGISAKQLGIGKEDDTCYLQCPDPGEPYTCGGSVIFKLIREPLSETS